MKSAPVYDIAPRNVVAVEHPMIVKNLDNGLRTFGNGPAFKRILHSDSIEACIPLYTRPNDFLGGRVLSRNHETNNILLKVTVPKRTGRKRKRGTDGPFVGEPSTKKSSYRKDEGETEIRSQARLDDPLELLRTLQDNVDKYEVEAVASIPRTHRFRSLADFHHSTTHTEFGDKARNVIASGRVENLRKMAFNPQIGWKNNEELMPPPVMSIPPIPVNWAYHQSAQVKDEEDETIAGDPKGLAPPAFRVEQITAKAETIPAGWPYAMPTDPKIVSLVAELEKAFEERPLWIRRALVNRISRHPHAWLIKSALHYVGYQFSSGPFRDCVVKYGVDPRTDSKYYIYQTLTFQALHHEEYDSYSKLAVPKDSSSHNSDSHLFDGKNLLLEGKVWQLCDITDPLLSKLVKNAPIREKFHPHDGYLHNGIWAKIRGIMKVKILGLLYKIPITEKHLEPALNSPDIIKSNQHGNTVHIPFPNFTPAEKDILDRLSKGTTMKPIHRLQPKSGANKSKRRERIAKFAEDSENKAMSYSKKPGLLLGDGSRRGSNSSIFSAHAINDEVIPSVEQDVEVSETLPHGGKPEIDGIDQARYENTRVTEDDIEGVELEMGGREND